MTTKRKGELYTKSFSNSDDIRAKLNAFLSTKSIKLRHPKNVFFGHLNLNSICNKLASIQELIKSIEKHISESTSVKLTLMIHFQMRSSKLKFIKVLGKNQVPLEEDFCFTLMKS